MQNSKDDSKTYDLKIEKVIPKPAAEVFRAIGEGRLFQNCSADTGSMKIDFRVGGKYEIQFRHFGMTGVGEFLEIAPVQKIVFTWCQDYANHPKPDTVVTVDLREQDGQTHLTLVHTGFHDEESRNAHEGGWKGGFDDLSAELSNGTLRFMRRVKMPVERLYETCKHPGAFFGAASSAQNGEVDFRVGGRYSVATGKGELSGEFLEIIPSEKIALSWKSAPYGEKLAGNVKATLTFEKDDDDSQISWLGLVHEGLNSEFEQKSHRAGWDRMLEKLSKEPS